ncbi:4Fe-4S dicluster domain-containing protein [Candidatus Formimonas warabiya]|uniref:4Fe-4S ferredoxin n=1 Tax=Formimonas warabiya TaxID=1761012 RepID=A0A3G1KRL9_FORW1|nr:4Fe-4S dicluster domain-containing protein [Candidatus Formimonas warabiya]ATW25109.1 4Fe-4S ferredoxin [Candidatus Formimonas warabiya]
MSEITAKMRETAKDLLEKGEVHYVIGWEKGRFPHQSPPAFVTSAGDVERLVWDEYCLAGTAKYLLDDKFPDGKIGLFVRGCDARAVNRLLQDGQIKRENIYLIGIPCRGMKDPDTGETAKKCLECTHPNPVVFDVMIGEKVAEKDKPERFHAVTELEKKSADEKYEYWAKQYDKCIRCYACRNVCPACNCKECFVDQYRVGWQGKQNNRAENQFFGLTRAMHIADRCIECGECERACPMNLPLMELNRKLIKDINELFGPYEAAVDPEEKPPLGYYKEDDPEKFM